MIERKTTLIIGAGASQEFNLPTGTELKERIANLLDIRFEHGREQISGNYTICDALRVSVSSGPLPTRDINPHLYAAWRIRDAMPQALSIDHFIDTHQGDKRLELCGKLAIVSSILEAESKSNLFIDPSTGQRYPNFKALQTTWFTSFFQILTENCKLEQIKKRFLHLTLIIFNYDRCVEHALFYALQNFYGISSEKSGELLSKLEIFHPYGTVGPLPWQTKTGPIDFGAEPDPRSLLRLATQIRTFSEGTDPTQSDIVKIRKKVTQSNLILFLGFAYHRLNLQLIWPQPTPHDSTDEVRYFGSALNLSPSDCEIIKNELSLLGGALPHQIQIHRNLTCAKLFQEYWRSLSLTNLEQNPTAQVTT